MSSLSTKSLLVIDDDRMFCDMVQALFKNHQIDVAAAHEKKKARQICRDAKFDVVLLDQKLPDGDGIELCRPILDEHDQTKIIFITAYPSFDNAIKAIRSGAFDYLQKPVELDELELTVKRAIRTLELERLEQVHKFKTQQDDQQTVLIGKGGGLKQIHRLIDLSAESDAPVMITGETGTGKNVVAKSIHYRQKHKKSDFVGVNCAALPENLIESELFGHEKGAFTGAISDKKGVFEMARGGTLFLDEIGEIPLHLQSKLLGVLDDKKLKPVGGHTFRKVDVRVIAATNIAMETAITEKKFRQDLYYRLSVIRIHLPPLRKRKGDIPDLCEYFLFTLARLSGLKFYSGEIENLMQYEWPGNVRELKNVIERSIILQKDGFITPSKLLQEGGQLESYPKPAGNPEAEQIKTLAEAEKVHILKILKHTGFNHTQTAKILDVSRSTLIRKLKIYNIHSGVAK